MPRKKRWSKMVEEHGVRIRIYERPDSAVLWYSVVTDGKKVRRSLKTPDRQLAKERAQEIAREVAEVQLTGGVIPGSITLGRLRKLYLHHRGPMLSDRRRRGVGSTLQLLESFLGGNFKVTDFGQHQVDGFVSARAHGRLILNDYRASSSPAPDTIRNDLEAFSNVCNWACGFRMEGRPLLGFNPLRGLQLPREENPARPLATEDRYQRLLKVSEEADPTGRLRCLLVLAWETGRRLSSLVRLRASDILLTPEQLRAALAEEGQDESWADHWPQAIRWRAEADKQGFLSFSPLTAAAQEALERYGRRHPVVGGGWLFPRDERHFDEHITRRVAAYRLRAAEGLAELPHQKRGGWHGFRRAWATRRKHLPVQDVMAAGGWRDINALQRAYQAADPETVRRVMELG